MSAIRKHMGHYERDIREYNWKRYQNKIISKDGSTNPGV
jgi:hypothetical protein